MSPYQSPRRIAESAGLTVYDEDEFKLERINDILREGSLGLKLTIDRSTPVKLNLYGEILELRTQAETVAGLLEEKGVLIAQDDKIRPKETAKLSRNQTVFVLGTDTDIVTEKQSIQFAEEEITDGSQEIGYRHVKTPGELGTRKP